MSKQRKGIFRYTLFFLATILGIGAILAYNYYRKIYLPNTTLESGTAAYLTIPTGADYPQVLDSLRHLNVLKDVDGFDWVAQRKSYPELVKSGRYKIEAGMDNNSLVNRLRIGDQEPLQLLIKALRTKEDFAAAVATQIELDKESLLNAMNDPTVYKKYGFTKENFLTMFLPNTYEFMWDTQTDAFIERMANEFKKFWTKERVVKAKQLGLSQSKAYILASIVQTETSRPDEMSRVAGVYLNRLNRGMLLQADPTLIFALGDFSIKRVLNVHKQINSPYNTYRFKGLPPGPIYMPDLSTIESVLNAEKHNYLYFCAKPDFSGYHDFATNYRDHINNARRYHRALNARKIYN